MPVDLINGRSHLEEHRVPILQPVVGIADFPAHLELDIGVGGAQVALPKNGRRLWPATN